MKTNCPICLEDFEFDNVENQVCTVCNFLICPDCLDSEQVCKECSFQETTTNSE